MHHHRIYYEQIHWHDPEQVFPALFSGKKYTFWLEGKKYSYMGSSVKRIKYNTSNHSLRISNNSKSKEINTDIFTYLKKELINTAPFSSSYPFGFTGGYIGCLSYETRRDRLHNTSRRGLPTGTPDAHFLFVDKFLAFDHTNKTLYLVSVSLNNREARTWFSTVKKQLTNLPIKPHHIPPGKTKNITFTISKDHKQYLKDINTCKKYLIKGHAYQICLTNQISAKLNVNRLSLYLTLRQTNPAPYNAYINFGDFALLSSSPELFLQVDNKRNIISQPMKGTLPRGKTPQEDKKLRNRLGKTLKDYAENIMIVDLVRNDLGRVCEFGSIKVAKPLTVKTYATVHQLVSTIKGKLKKNITAIDALRSAFPGGSMTGTPKIRAMEIISKIEKQSRGIYSGTFGYLSLNGTANLAMTIRTIIASKNKLTFGTGGAILMDSIPEDEYNEMILKSKALISAIMKTTGAKTYKIIGG